MPTNVRAICFQFFAHLTAADIYRLQGSDSRHEIHLDEARRDAKHLLERHSDAGDAHSMNKHLAEYEGRWEDALKHIQNAVRQPGLWLFQRYTLPRLLYRLRRLDEALAGLDAMPDGLKAVPTWVRDRVFIVSELGGTGEAEATYRRWLEKNRALPTGRHLPYEVYRFLGRPADAVEFTRRRLQEIHPPLHQERFDIAADEYVSGQMSAEALLAAATEHGDRMWAHYVIGLERLSEGERAGAITHFTEIERAGSYTLARQPWAYLLLNRLREDPAWPPWIPLRKVESRKSK